MGEGNDDNWEMPKPVFRSSTGSLPKSFEATISQSFSPDTDTAEIDEDDDILGVMDTPASDGPAAESNDEPVPAVENEGERSEQVTVASVRTVPVKTPTKPAGTRSFLFIFVLIALLAAAVVAGLIYYFTNVRTTDSNF